jgi:hypothetical protein
VDQEVSQLWMEGDRDSPECSLKVRHRQHDPCSSVPLKIYEEIFGSLPN